MPVSLVLAGGVALGAYHGGALAKLHERPDLWPQRIVGSSVGAVMGALAAGNPPEARIGVLREFWEEAAVDTAWGPAESLGRAWRRASNHWAILEGRALGRAGFFEPGFAQFMLGQTVALYDPAPLAAKLAAWVDFERLNRSSFSLMTTDVESGEPVVFDTRRGATIAPEHLVASCGFLPDFPPVEIDGRLLGDGGFVANAPVACALDWEHDDGEWLVFLIDLFACAGSPMGPEASAGRRLDLLFGNQTRQALRLLALEHRLHGWRSRVRILHLAYRAAAEEGGPEKPFNFARSTLEERWDAGRRDMEEAIRLARAGFGEAVKGTGRIGVCELRSATPRSAQARKR